MTVPDVDWFVCSCLHRSDYHAINLYGSCRSCSCSAYDGPQDPPPRTEP